MRELRNKKILVTKLPATNSNNLDKDEWYSAKSEISIPRQCGIYFFEIKILSFSEFGGQFAIGIGSPRSSVSRNAPGLDHDSYGFYPCSGNLCIAGVQYNIHPPNPIQPGSVFGFGVNFIEDEIFFTSGSELLGHKRLVNLKRDTKNPPHWAPMIAVKNVEAELAINFGPKYQFSLPPYIQNYQLLEINRAHQYFSKDSTNEVEVRELILHFLLSHGFNRTAEAMYHNSSSRQTMNINTELQFMETRWLIGSKLFTCDYAAALQIIEQNWPEFVTCYPILHFKLLVMRFRSKIIAYLGGGGVAGGSRLSSRRTSSRLKSKVSPDGDNSANRQLRTLQSLHLQRHKITKTQNGSLDHHEPMEVDNVIDVQTTQESPSKIHEIEELIEFGSILKEKSLELYNSRTCDLEYDALLKTLFSCIASGDCPLACQPSNAQSLLHDVDAALFALKPCKKPLASHLSRELDTFDKLVLSDRISLQPNVLLQAHLHRCSVNSSPTSGLPYSDTDTDSDS